MANTGKKIVLTLKQVTATSQTPTGLTKNNVVGQSDYIAPYTDNTTCPITYNTDCPDVIKTVDGDSLEYEFSLYNSVLKNPSIARVKIGLYQSSVEMVSNLVNLPHSNYFYGMFNSLAAGSYDLQIDYLNSSNVSIHTCSISTITI